jgi:hypothetical protein
VRQPLSTLYPLQAAGFFYYPKLPCGRKVDAAQQVHKKHRLQAFSAKKNKKQGSSELIPGKLSGARPTPKPRATPFLLYLTPQNSRAWENSTQAF